MGGLLCTTNLSEWKRSESEIWDLPEDKCGIIPALRLSYHHLPSHLKCCFAYCSIFPKDYEFEEEIILLWSAEGFLQQKTKLPFKDLGNQYFQDLVSRSFFQISSKDESQYVMHDLINDLAQLVAGDICCRLEENEQQMFSHRCRHSSYIISRYDTVKKFKSFNQANSLRTFLPLKQDCWHPYYLTNVVLVELLPRLGYLRVLSLCRYWITELPDCLENLKHLRHFNLSHTQIRCLPDSLCTLYHLETFLLKRCSKLQNLPSKMENLVNLHYLDIRGADLIERMPFGIGNLTNLQRLSDFVIGEGDGHRIGELKNLSNLKGDLCLSGLENVNGRDAWEARLNKKSGINNLVLEWSGDFEPTRKNQVEERVLDSLHPPKKLEQLVIKNFGGAKFSTWITDSSFSNLSSLELRSCKNCKSLPPIGRLSSLKGLSIGGLVEVRKIGYELFGENQSVAFASLESLSFESLPNWEEWDACEGDEQVSKLPMLRKLSIRHCPRLLGRLPTRLQSLQKLEIYECMRLVVSISSYPSLHELTVEGCEELVDECSSSSPGEEVTSLQCVNLFQAFQSLVLQLRGQC
ncbi:putative disease resistance RPP13-like protein 1 [Hibiscus syriacus]|uniref:putative disease resistance RPP13-like protein 1 n=1 Tax=Hibiscus syriacus TaxID=106335 RepID=UPI001920CC50|nr:putative disease resistance RPP13-like protein 1 [Hibiscus syriacus]